MTDAINAENLEKLFAAAQDEPGDIEFIYDSLMTFLDYADAIYKSELWLKIYNRQNLPPAENYEAKVKTLSAHRSTCHNRALGAVTGLNRLADSYGISAIYDGEVNEKRPTRTVVADAMLLYLGKVLSGRIRG